MCMYSHIYIYTFMCMYIYIHTYIRFYLYIYIYIHIYLFIYDLFTWSKDHIGRLFGSLRPTILDLSGLSKGRLGTGDRWDRGQRGSLEVQILQTVGLFARY